MKLRARVIGERGTRNDEIELPIKWTRLDKDLAILGKWIESIRPDEAIADICGDDADHD